MSVCLFPSKVLRFTSTNSNTGLNPRSQSGTPPGRKFSGRAGESRTTNSRLLTNITEQHVTLRHASSQCRWREGGKVWGPWGGEGSLAGLPTTCQSRGSRPIGSSSCIVVVCPTAGGGCRCRCAARRRGTAAVSKCGWRGSLPSSFYSSKDSEHPASHPGLVIPATHAEVASASRDP